jgi:hypothetical protein
LPEKDRQRPRDHHGRDQRVSRTRHDSFLYHSYKNGLPKGFFRGEFSWVLENNTMMIRVAEMLDAVPYKTYRLYDKAIPQ